MGIGSSLLSMLPSGISRECSVIKSLFSDSAGSGAIANQLDDLITFVDDYSAIDDVREKKGESLTKIANYFIGLERYHEETDQNLINRLMAITTRGGDVVWGTRWNIKRLFENYFANASIFVCENTSNQTENLIKDYDFEENDGSWNLAGCTRTLDAAFSESYGVNTGPAGICKQSVSLSAGTYSLHFFNKGSGNVVVKNTTTGKYWNRNTQAWVNSMIEIPVASEKWEDRQEFFKISSLGSIEISFMGTTGSSLNVDYVRLTKKLKHGEFTVIIHYEGNTSGKVLSLEKGISDPIPGINYDRASYFDVAFMQGKASGTARDIYEDVLDIVKPSGVKANIEFLMKAV